MPSADEPSVTDLLEAAGHLPDHATFDVVESWLGNVRESLNGDGGGRRALVRDAVKNKLEDVEVVSTPGRLADSVVSEAASERGSGGDRNNSDPTPPEELLETGRAVLDSDDQLALFRESLEEQGFAGATEAAELCHVGFCSRGLERPLGLAFHGPSAAGKTFTVQVTAAHHPDDAMHDVSAMSERYLAYADFPTEHRYVSISEASALHNDGVGATIIRELSWNRRLRYGTVVRTEDGPEAVTIEKPGPTGLITTTTKPLDDEISTRLIAVHITDSPEQTRRVVEELAREAAGERDGESDLSTWKAASEWLVQAGDREVVVPFARHVAEGVPADSVRMRRDFEQVMTVVRALAFMHQRTRPRDDQGRIVAIREDYANAHRLLAETMAVTLDRVSDATRETVEAVEELTEDQGPGEKGVSYPDLATALDLSRSGAWRRAKRALREGYLANAEQREGYPARLVLADPLPEDRAVLPGPETIPPSENPPESAQDLKGSPQVSDTEGDTTVEDPDSRVGGIDSRGGGIESTPSRVENPEDVGENAGGIEPLSGNQGGPEEGGGEDPSDDLPEIPF